MKLVSFLQHGRRRLGVLRGDRVAVADADFHDEYPDVPSVLSNPQALGRLRTMAERASATVAFDGLALLPPVPNPSKVVCVGINYETHRSETGRAESAFPSIFLRFPDTGIGSGAPIRRPRVSSSLDFEGELAVVIGRAGRYIAQDDALAHVAGYACYNDVTLRDWQRHTHQFTPGKNFPDTGAFGPWLVTADEIPDPSTLRLITRLNGRVMQDARTADMIFSVERIIEYVSSFTMLRPGDVIATGTPGGVGFKREPPVFMEPGDDVEVEISGIGVLRNPVADEVDTAVRDARVEALR